MLLGSMLRIDVDSAHPYAIPPDNPFVNDAAALDEIWAYGLRNVWRFSFDRATGNLYMADVGQNQWEEINFQRADSRGGENYGWNIFEAYTIFAGGNAPGHVPPIAAYNHGLGCSVTGGAVYRGSAIPDLQGVYLYGDFCTGRIWGRGETAACPGGRQNCDARTWKSAASARTRPASCMSSTMPGRCIGLRRRIDLLPSGESPPRRYDSLCAVSDGWVMPARVRLYWAISVLICNSSG